MFIIKDIKENSLVTIKIFSERYHKYVFRTFWSVADVSEGKVIFYGCPDGIGSYVFDEKEDKIVDIKYFRANNNGDLELV